MHLGRSVVPAGYAARMAMAGSIPAARNAGVQHATTPTAAIITATPMNALGSCGATPKSSPNGSASMSPGTRSGNTTVCLHLPNPTPGGVHPWQLHRGQCESDEDVFGSAELYQPATVGGDGRATSSATVPIETPTTGSYFVVVRASAANEAMTVACGNLAPPTL